MKVLIFKALIDSNISDDEFVLVNNMLKDYLFWFRRINKLIRDKNGLNTKQVFLSRR